MLRCLPSSALVARSCALSFVFLAACQTSREEGEVQDVAWLVRHGEYAKAREEARTLVELSPDDPQARELLRGAEAAYLLELGRRSVLDGDGKRGLVFFRQALELDTDNDVALGWILKTRVQLAEEALDLGWNESSGGDLDLAESYFEEVLSHLPRGTESERIETLRYQAKSGLDRVLLTKNYRETQSASYFREGMNDLRVYRLPSAAHGFGVSLEYDEDNERATNRKGDVDSMLASEMLAKAEGLEASGLYSAARNEYRRVLLIEEDSQPARDGLDRMDVEVRVNKLLAKAEMDLLRGDFGAAENGIEGAADITGLQTDAVGRLRAQLQDARFEEMYQEAFGLERDYLFLEAVQAYEELLAEAESYRDAIRRRNSLREFILLAQDLYAKGIAAETDEEAAEFLRQIPVFWPEYLDVDKRLAEIERRLAAKQPAEPEAVEPTESVEPATETDGQGSGADGS